MISVLYCITLKQSIFRAYSKSKNKHSKQEVDDVSLNTPEIAVLENRRIIKHEVVKTSFLEDVPNVEYSLAVLIDSL